MLLACMAGGCCCCSHAADPHALPVPQHIPEPATIDDDGLET
jgi:hypothetical protein